MDKDKALNFNERRDEKTQERKGKILGGKFSGIKSQRTARKLERERILSDPKLIAQKLAEIKVSSRPSYIPQWLKNSVNEDHAMDKPKPLEEVSDGDLSEIKKDPIWKTWLKNKRIGDCFRCGKKDKKLEEDVRQNLDAGGQPFHLSDEKGGRFSHEWDAFVCPDCVKRIMSGQDTDEEAKIMRREWGGGRKLTDTERQSDHRPTYLDMSAKHKAWEVWLNKQDEDDIYDEEDEDELDEEDEATEAERKVQQVVGGGAIQEGLHLIGLSRKSWLEKKEDWDKKENRKMCPDCGGPMDEHVGSDEHYTKWEKEERKHNKRLFDGKKDHVTPFEYYRSNFAPTSPENRTPEQKKFIKERLEGIIHGGVEDKYPPKGVKKPHSKHLIDPKDKNYLDDYRRENQRKREQKRNENIHSDFTGDPDKMTPTPEQISRKRVRDEKEAQEAIDSKARHTHRRKKKSWEEWLEKKERIFNEHKCTECGKTRPKEHFTNPLGRTRGICDSCNSPFFDPNDPEDAKIISFMDQMNQEEDLDEKGTPTTSKKSYITKPIPDSKGGKGSFQHCINANQDKHNPGGWCKQIERKVEGKKKGRDEGEEEEVKISFYEKLRRIKDKLQAHNKARQTKIDKPKDWWDHSKVGTNTGWDDDPMNNPSYFFAVMAEERRKKEKEKKKADKIEEPESDYYMDAGGNPQRKEKTDKCPGCEGEGKKWHIGFMAPYSTDCPGCKGRGRLTPTEQQDKDAKEADDKQFNKLTEKADYFVEEIRANIIYHNKIFPLVGMIAGQVARGVVSSAGKKAGKQLLGDVGEMSQDMMAEEGGEQ